MKAFLSFSLIIFYSLKIHKTQIAENNYKNVTTQMIHVILPTKLPDFC